VPLIWRQAASMFAGIQTQQGDYMGLQLRFPSRTGGEVPLDFIMDTASSVNIVLPDVATSLNAPRTGTTTSGGVGGTGVTASSYEVTLGGAAMYDGTPFWQADVRAVVMAVPTAPGTAGLIGLTLLNACAAVALDWSVRPGTATLFPPGSSAWMARTHGLAEIPLVRVNVGLPCLSVIVNGTPALALLDTGAAFSVMNIAMGVAGDPAVEPMWVAGANGSPTAMAVAASAVDVVVEPASGLALKGLVPLVGDLPAFTLLGLPPGKPAMILGLDALLDRPRLVLSTVAMKLWL